MTQDPLHLLCIEPRFPGRLGAVADWLVRKRGYRCWFYCNTAEAPDHWPASAAAGAGNGLDVITYGVGGVAREPSAHWSRGLERGLCYAYGCWEVLHPRPPRPVDLVLGRSAGLGSALFSPVTLPGAPVVSYFDYFHHAHANDLAGEASAAADTPAEYFHWRRSADAMSLLELESGATPWTPTRWQRDLFPREYRDDFTVLFDGIDVDRFDAAPARRDRPRTIAGRSVPTGARVVSFVARSLDRLRGFDRFLELANRLMRSRTDVICVAAGSPVVQRGLDVQFYNQDYAAHLLAKTPPHDPARFWQLGSLAPAGIAELLAASDLHVYPSRPYPVARSLLEAMATGCVVLALDTEPVREFVTHGQTGLVAPTPPDGRDGADDAARLALAALDDPATHRPLGDAAAVLVRQHCARDVTMPKLAASFDSLV